MFRRQHLPTHSDTLFPYTAFFRTNQDMRSQPLSLGILLGTWAHPDDETYLSAGLMAQSVREGGRVVCVTATRGEGGSWDEARWPTAEMGKIREDRKSTRLYASHSVATSMPSSACKTKKNMYE